MAPVQSSHAEDGGGDAAERAKKLQQLQLFNVHMACNVALSLFVFNVRTEVLRGLVRNDVQRLTNILSSWAASIGLLEFLFNPTIGRLSDAFGRKPFMLAAPVASAILKTLTVLNPSLFTLTV